MQEYHEVQWLIFHTLGKLLKRTTLDRITTKQLCETCCISRQTFYRYFQDKYEVITWHFDLLAKNTLKQVGRTLTWRMAHAKLFGGLYNERAIYSNAIYSEDYNAIKKYAFRYSNDLFVDTLTNYLNISPTNLLLFQINATASICSELTFNWAKDGMKESPEEFAELIDTVLPEELKHVFEHDLTVLRHPSDRLEIFH